jgi:hypothetical protein
MTVVIRADEGKWITKKGFVPEQEQAPSFWTEVQTSVPELFEEVTDEEKQERIEAWNEAHPQPEPPQPEPNAEEV